MSSRSASPLRLALPLILVMALAALWSAYWYALSTKVQELYAASEMDFATDGVSLTCGSKRWGGYPFRITLNCTRPRLSFPASGGTGTINSDNLYILMQAYDYRHFIALLDGPTQLSLAGSPATVVTHGRATASLVVPGEAPARLAVEVPKPAAEGLVNAAAVLLNASFDRNGVVDAAASATKLNLLTPASLSLDTAALEVALPASIATASNPLKAAAATGTPLDLKHLEATQGNLTISANGRISLTPDGKPDGEVTTRISDLDLLLAQVNAIAKRDDQEIAAMKTLLILLSGTRTNASIVMKATAGTLYWGPFSVLELPSLL